MQFLNLGGIFQALGGLLIPGLAVSSLDVTVGAAGTYAPDLRKAAEHNIHATGATITIDNPVAPWAGTGWTSLLVTHIRNESGGAITVTWGSAYRQSAFTDPANGSGVISLWHFDNAVGLWYGSARQTVANA